MGYHYSDPTVNMALGSINREFSKLEKKAKKLREKLDKGEISRDTVERAQAQFTGIYRHVLTIALEKRREEADDSSAS